MTKTRNRYSGHVKFQAALRLLKGEATAVEIAREVGCHPTLVAEWKERLLANAQKLFDPAEADDKEKHIAKLERLIGKLTVQNDFLEKVLTTLNRT